MKQILKNIDKNSLIGIYRFKENDFIVGNIIKLSDNYLFLNSCDIFGKYNGIKIVDLNIIDRLIVKSDYIDSLNELRKNENKENKKTPFVLEWSFLFILIPKFIVKPI